MSRDSIRTQPPSPRRPRRWRPGPPSTMPVNGPRRLQGSHRRRRAPAGVLGVFERVRTDIKSVCWLDICSPEESGRGSVTDGGADFPALRLTNEGRTPGPVGVSLATGDRLLTLQAAEFGRILSGDHEGAGGSVELCRASQAAACRRRAPGRCGGRYGSSGGVRARSMDAAAGVPNDEHGEPPVVVHGEATSNDTAGLEGAQVAGLAWRCWWTP